MGWGRVVVFYFRVLVNVCVCVSSVRVLGWGGKVVAFCFCVLGNVYSYLMYIRIPPPSPLRRTHPLGNVYSYLMLRLRVLLLPPQALATPLHYAAYHGKEAVAELLLRHKADVNMVGQVSADGCAGGGVGWGGRGGGELLYFFLGCWSMCVCVCI